MKLQNLSDIHHIASFLSITNDIKENFQQRFAIHPMNIERTGNAKIAIKRIFKNLILRYIVYTKKLSPSETYLSSSYGENMPLSVTTPLTNSGGVISKAG